MFGFRALTGAGFALGLAFGITAAATPARAADPGVTDSEILLGMWAPLSGPQALIGTSARDGVEVGVKEVNDAGGIHGRKLRVIVYDDAGTPQEAMSAVRRLIDQDGVFALIGASSAGATLPVMPVVNREEVPLLVSAAAHRNLFKPFAPTTFRIYANEVAQATEIVNYSLDASKFTKPAIIYNSNDYGVGGMETVSAELKKHGIELVAAERYNTGDQDFSAQLLRIREAGADALYVWSFAAEAGIIVRQAKELGLDVAMYGGGATTTPLFPKGAGAAGAGFTAPWVFPYTEAMVEVPAIGAYHKLLNAHYSNNLPPSRPSLYDLAGYGTLKIVAEALNRVEGEPTREKFVAAVESLENFDTGVLFPVTFTADDHEGSSQTSIIAVQDDLTWKLK